MKIFFSHASEDKNIVEQVFQVLKEKYPDIIGWIDKFEIKGGDQLIDKIVEGIENADKFLIFLSNKSISKSWVNAELRKAVMKELNNINPDFIIPIKIGEIDKFPAFLESKKYINLSSLIKEEWSNEIYQAISNKQNKKDFDLKENLEMTITRTSDNDSALGIIFKAKFWAESIGFKVKTKKKVIQGKFDFRWRQGGLTLNYSDLKEDYAYSVHIPTINISPGKDFIIFIVFEEPVTVPEEFIERIEKWQGHGGNTGTIFKQGENLNYK